MRFRFTYSTNGMDDFVATDPGGWDEAAIGFERDPKLLSLVEFFKGSFATYGINNQPVQYDNTRMIDGGRDWILAAEKLNGADSKITQLIEIDENDINNWEYFFRSVLSVNEFSESMNHSHLLNIVSSQQDFWALFVKRFNIPVDLKSLVDLDGNVVTTTPSFTLPLPNQIINKGFKGRHSEDINPHTLASSQQVQFILAAGEVGQLDFAFKDLDELTQKFTIPISNAGNLANPIFSLDFAGDVVINSAQIILNGFTIFYKNWANIDVYIQVGNNAPAVFTRVDSGVDGVNGKTTYTYNGTFTAKKKDEIRLYVKNNSGGTLTFFWFDYEDPTFATSPTLDSHLDVYQKTVYDDTTTEAFLTYDVIKGIIKRICGAPFKSDYLGNPYTSDVYGAIGCGSNLANMIGLHLRGYLLTDKPLQLSAQAWHDGINPIHCLGIGYEKIANIDTIVCERAEHFFDGSNVSVNFLNIYDIKRSYDQENQFNKFSFGYEKWESKSNTTGIGIPSGIDDAQSQRSWTDIFKFIGKELKQFSKWVTASYTIEGARRTGVNQSSNYDYDNDVFAIKLHDTGGGAYIPETDQSFSAITNLLNSNTRYNSDLTPARNLLRWKKYWSGGLQDYVGSIIKFASGIGNFLMTSIKTTSCEGDETGDVIAENGDFIVGDDYLFFPMPFEINHKLDWTTYKYLRDHKNWAITISQDNNVGEKAFIKSLEYIKAKGEVKMTVWPKRRFSLKRVESVTDVTGIPHIRYFEIAFAPEFS